MNSVNLNQSAVDIDIDNLEKAAILLLSMGTESAAKVMQKLSRDEVQRLISKMASLSGVSSMEAKWTLQQFFNQYREQSGIGSASREYLEQTLDLALGQRRAKPPRNVRPQTRCPCGNPRAAFSLRHFCATFGWFACYSATTINNGPEFNGPEQDRAGPARPHP